jgi:hypothetical protein
MNESITETTRHFTPAASLAALGVILQQKNLFEPIRQQVKIEQKTVKYTPIDKLYDGFIALLAGAHGLVEITTRLRSDPALQAAFGRTACAEQSVVQETLDHCTTENVKQMQQASDTIYRLHSRGYRHPYQDAWQVLDVDMSGWLCGNKAAFATKGYFATTQRNRRGRQLGRVLASHYDEEDLMGSNSPSPHFWPILRWVILATIPALVTLIPAIQSWTHNISLTIIILITCAIFLFLFYIVSKIFQQMEDLWIKEMASTVDQFIRNCFSHYSHYYRLYFSYEHRDMDMKGLNTLGTHTLSLEDVFVELHIDSTTPHEASADPLRLPAELRTGGHTIWEYLQAKSLRKEHFVLLGPPGSGKTTLLKHVGLVLLYARKFHYSGNTPFKIPLLLFLRNHSIPIQEIPGYSLVDAVRAQAEKWKRPMPPGWVEQQLDKGQCLILLDGLDEVADSISRRQTISWVE